MRWLIVLPFERPGLAGMDFADELRALGHEVRTLAYRRDNPLYKNRGTKTLYQRFILGQLERAQLLICDELGYVSLSRGGVELLFRVFGDRYERASMLVTSNLPFSEWNQIFQGERMTAALLDRLTHHCHIFEMNGESYRFRESMKSKKSRKAE